MPESWRLVYRKGDDWLPVEALTPYGFSKDTLNTVQFKPVTTNALRIEVQLPKEEASGMYEWEMSAASGL